VQDASLAAHPPGAYRLVVDAGGCTIRAFGAPGFYYGRQTLAQLDRQHAGRVPFLEIEDWPDYPVRGFYHDITRGKVPTLETLLALAERCARYKLNHLELYIEHTFAYRTVPEVWEGADPLTADEIRALDAFCAARHIDLVPSFSTFGHFLRFLRVPRLQHLNELDVRAAEEPFCWWDMMQHYTLAPGNPESLALVRGIIEEVAPLFTSRYFNVCCDETFDLGKGKSREAAARVGTGRVYVDFLKEILGIVRSQGRVPMFWGDIVGRHPEYLDELGDDAIALDWDYTADLSGTRAELFRAAGRKFYVCAGTGSWAGPFPQMSDAARNINALARRGAETGAAGFLLTDWGDYGHPCPLGLSFPGLAQAAASAWQVPGTDPFAFDEAISMIEFGDRSGRLVGELRGVASGMRAEWRMLAFWKQPRARDFSEDWFDAGTGIPMGALKLPFAEHLAARDFIAAASVRIGELLASANPDDPLVAGEIRVALLGALALENVFLCLRDRAGQRPAGAICPAPNEAAVQVRDYAQQLEAVWHLRNKPSEFFRLRDLLAEVATELESW
jgi:hypothetical protein